MKIKSRSILGTLLLWSVLALNPSAQGTTDEAAGPWEMGTSSTSTDGALSSTDTFRSTGTGSGGQDGTGTMPNPAGTPNPPAPPQR